MQLKSVLIVSICASAFQVLSLGQGTSGVISGVVRDQTESVLPGTIVSIRNVDTGIVRTITANEQGRYRAERLDLGSYEISAELPGFRRAVRGGITLTLGQDAVVNLTLEVGEVSDEITVEQGGLLVDTTSSSVDALVDEKKIRDLPLNGRDFVQLATLQAGIHVARAHGSGTNSGQGLQISIAGSRPVQNNFRLDGISLNDYTGSTTGSVNGVNLGVEGIREFSVMSSTYSAEYGRSAGGVVTAATRSGTNEFHGTLFYFHRNDNLDARNFFDVGELPEFRRHQFGAAIGGPIVANKSFFFLNYERLDEVRGNTRIDTTLSDNAREGRLQSGNIDVDPKVAPFLEFFPRPNGEILGDTGLFIFANDLVADEDFWTTRIDHHFSESDFLFGRYTISDANRLQDSRFALKSVETGTRNQSFTLEETHIFSPTFLNTVRFGFVRTFNPNNIDIAKDPTLDNPDFAFIPESQVPGTIEVAGLSIFPGGTGALDSDINTFNAFQYYDDVVWTRGSHSLKIGAMGERIQFNPDSQSRQSGEFRFRDIRDFLLNIPRDLRAKLPGSDTIRGWRQWLIGWYIQDDWNVTPNFTLNLGLRHEFITVPTEVNGKVANMPEVTSPQPRVGDPLFENPSLENFAPRIGFAWDPFGQGKTSIRAGYGIFYDQLLPHFLIITGVRNPPFFLRGSITDPSQGSFPDGAFEELVNRPTLDLRAERIPFEANQAYVQQWNLTIQQEIAFNTLLSIGYVGSHGVHLNNVVEDANLAVPVICPEAPCPADAPAGARFFPEGQQRRNPGFEQVRDRLFDGHSFYNALNLELRKRWSHGFQLQTTYTWAKNIDDNSITFTTSESANAIGIPVTGDAKFNRGPANHDIGHRFGFNMTWDIPFPSDSRVGNVFGGWQVGTMIQHTTGLPFTATLQYDAARTLTSRPDNEGGQRPDLVPGEDNNPIIGDPNQWFDVSAFARPRDGFLGNLGRGTLRGDDLTNVDLTLVKQIPLRRLGEAGSLDFRVEFFNILNQVNFDLPSFQRQRIFTRSGRVEDAGRITGTSTISREIQFGLKVFF